MNPALSVARKATAAAISSGCAKRPMGTLERYSFSLSLPGGLLARKSSVSVGPGATAFAVAVRCQFDCHRPRQALQRTLGCSVARSKWQSSRDKTRNTDDATKARFAHGR